MNRYSLDTFAGLNVVKNALFKIYLEKLKKKIKFKKYILLSHFNNIFVYINNNFYFNLIISSLYYYYYYSLKEFGKKNFKRLN